MNVHSPPPVPENHCVPTLRSAENRRSPSAPRVRLPRESKESKRRRRRSIRPVNYDETNDKDEEPKSKKAKQTTKKPSKGKTISKDDSDDDDFMPGEESEDDEIIDDAVSSSSSDVELSKNSKKTTSKKPTIKKSTSKKPSSNDDSNYDDSKKPSSNDDGAEYQLTNIDQPHSNDVGKFTLFMFSCCVSSASILNPSFLEIMFQVFKTLKMTKFKENDGTKFYQDLLDKNLLPYMLATNEKKARVANRIVDTIRAMSPTGRFLRMDDQSGLFNDAGNQFAIEKTKQALRGAARASNIDTESLRSEADTKLQPLLEAMKLTKNDDDDDKLYQAISDRMMLEIWKTRYAEVILKKQGSNHEDINRRRITISGLKNDVKVRFSLGATPRGAKENDFLSYEERFKRAKAWIEENRPKLKSMTQDDVDNVFRNNGWRISHKVLSYGGDPMKRDGKNLSDGMFLTMIATLEEFLVGDVTMQRYMHKPSLHHVSGGFPEVINTDRYLTHVSPSGDLLFYDQSRFMKNQEYKRRFDLLPKNVQEFIIHECDGKRCIMAEELLYLVFGKEETVSCYVLFSS